MFNIIYNSHSYIHLQSLIVEIIIIIDESHIPAGVKHNLAQQRAIQIVHKALLGDDLSIVLHGEFHALLLQDLSCLNAGKVEQIAHSAQVDVACCYDTFFTQVLQPLYHVLIGQAYQIQAQLEIFLD